MIEDPAQAIDPQTTLKIYVDLVNSERQAIWARNGAMLIGNSFIVNAIKSEMTGSSPDLYVTFSIAGITICLLWAIMTWLGWGYFHRCIDAAVKAAPGEGNPLFHFHRRRTRDPIFLCTMGVIAVFVIVYAFGLSHFLQSARGA